MVLYCENLLLLRKIMVLSPGPGAYPFHFTSIENDVVRRCYGTLLESVEHRGGNRLLPSIYMFIQLMPNMFPNHIRTDSILPL